jgi:hypothetical protein
MNHPITDSAFFTALAGQLHNLPSDCEVCFMRKRVEPRHLARLRVKLTGTDGSGCRYEQTVFTHDVSERGARISGAPQLASLASVVELEYRGKKACFRAVWIGGYANDEVGLMCMEPSRCIWGKPLPGQLTERLAERVLRAAAAIDLA